MKKACVLAAIACISLSMLIAVSGADETEEMVVTETVENSQLEIEDASEESLTSLDGWYGYWRPIGTLVEDDYKLKVSDKYRIYPDYLQIENGDKVEYKIDGSAMILSGDGSTTVELVPVTEELIEGVKVDDYYAKSGADFALLVTKTGDDGDPLSSNLKRTTSIMLKSKTYLSAYLKDILLENVWTTDNGFSITFNEEKEVSLNNGESRGTWYISYDNDYNPYISMRWDEGATVKYYFISLDENNVLTLSREDNPDIVITFTKSEEQAKDVAADSAETEETTEVITEEQ